MADVGGTHVSPDLLLQLFKMRHIHDTQQSGQRLHGSGASLVAAGAWATEILLDVRDRVMGNHPLQ